MLSALAGAVTARPWVTLAVTLVIGIVSLWGALQLEPATGVQDMLADDQPSAIAFAQTVEHFSLIDDLVLLVRLPQDEPGPDPDRLIAFAERLEAQLRTTEGVVDVRYRPSAQIRGFMENVAVPKGLFYLDDEARRAFAQRLEPEAMRAQFRQNASMLAAPGPAASRLAKELIRDPLRLREFLAEQARSLGGKSRGIQTRPGVEATVSVDGRALLMQVSATEPANNLPFTAAFMPRVRAAIAAAEPGDLRIDPTGGYAIAEYSSEQTRNDMIRSCLGSIGLLLVLFLIIYRSPLTMTVLALPLNFAIVAAFGLYVLVSGRLTPVTAVAGAVLAGLGIDYCVHYLSHHEAERRDRPDRDQRTISRFAVYGIGPAMFAACVTSSIGFGSVLGSGVRSLREFSLLGLLGLGLSLLAAITVLPALICALSKTPLGRSGLSRTRIHAAPAVLAIALRPRLSLGFAGLVGIVMAVTLLLASYEGEDGWQPPLKFDSDLHALHPKPHPGLETRELLADVFGASPDSLLIHLDADAPDAMLDLSQRVQQRFNQADLKNLGVAGVMGPATLLSEHPPDQTAATGAQLVGVDEVERLLETFRGAADAEGFNPGVFAEYETFLRTLMESGPPQLAEVQQYPELARMVLPRQDPSPTQGLVLVTLDRPWTTVQRRNQIIDEVRDALEPYRGATLTGLSVIGYDTQIAIGQDLSKLLWIALGAVLIWLTIFFRKPKDVLLALSPAVFALVSMLAFAEWAGWTLNVINLVALPLIVGIGVDDGIFLTAIYRRGRTLGLSRAQVLEQVAASAHAIVMTTLTTGLAFGSLVFTSVPAVQSLGMFTAVGVTAALFISLFGLVPLLLGRVK
jgi:predicted RND superfamily exporter protein